MKLFFNWQRVTVYKVSLRGNTTVFARVLRVRNLEASAMWPKHVCGGCFLVFLLNVMHEIQKPYLYGLDSCSKLVGLCDSFLFV